MLLALRVGKASLILRTLSVLLLPLEACVYDMPCLLVVWTGAFALKNLEILLTFLGVLAGIEGDSLSILASLSVSLPFDLPFLIRFVLGIQWYETFCLNKLLWTSAVRELHSAEELIFLFLIYLAIQTRDVLMYLALEGRCSNKP